MVRLSGVEIICHAVDLDAEPGALRDQMGALAAGCLRVQLLACSRQSAVGP